MSSATIRFAEKKDAPLLLSMIKEIAEYEKLTDEVTATEESLTESLFGLKPAAEALLLFSDDKPAAYAIFFHNFSTFVGKKGLYLEDIYVKPEFRSQGYGKQLFNHVLSLARERNCGRMEWAVLDWNRSAIDFYKRAGAVPMDDWTVFRLIP